MTSKTLICYVCGSKNIKELSSSCECLDCNVIAFKSRFAIYESFDLEGYNGVVVSGIQNNTALDNDAFSVMKSYAKTHNLRVILTPIYYNNQKKDPGINHEEQHLPKNTIKYMINGNMKVGNFTIACGTKVQATTPSPLNTILEVSGSNHMILPHSRRQILCKSTIGDGMPKIGMTTGVLTTSNVAQTSIGARSKFHHFKGFAVIHKEKDQFIARQVEIKGGIAHDLGYRYSHKKQPELYRPLGYVMGDFHASQISKLKLKLTEDFARMCRPINLILHDLFNAQSCNPHNAKNPKAIHNQLLHDAGKLDIKQELKLTFDMAHKIASLFNNTYQTWSNHDSMMQRWIEATDWRTDKINARFYIKAVDWLLDNITVDDEYGVNDYNGLMEWAIQYAGSKPIDIAPTDMRLGKFAVGLHGDKGEGGSRGSLNQYAKLPFKSIIGHAHKFGAQDGCLQTGTSTGLAKDYTGRTLTNWGWADVLVNRDGTAQHIIFYQSECGTTAHWGALFVNKLDKK